MTVPLQDDAREAHPALRLLRAAVLVVGAVVVLVLVEGAGLRFYWVPFLLGVLRDTDQEPSYGVPADSRQQF